MANEEGGQRWAAGVLQRSHTKMAQAVAGVTMVFIIYIFLLFMGSVMYRVIQGWGIISTDPACRAPHPHLGLLCMPPPDGLLSPAEAAHFCIPFHSPMFSVCASSLTIIILHVDATTEK